jgi:hypothetical protein
MVHLSGLFLASSGSSVSPPERIKDVSVRFGLVEARLMGLRSTGEGVMLITSLGHELK